MSVDIAAGWEGAGGSERAARLRSMGAQRFEINGADKGPVSAAGPLPPGTDATKSYATGRPVSHTIFFSPFSNDHTAISGARLTRQK